MFEMRLKLSLFMSYMLRGVILKGMFGEVIGEKKLGVILEKEC